eukprot:5228149-Amphidinium_carterae.1
MRQLHRCSASKITEYLRESASDAKTWVDTDWCWVTLAAKDYGPQQVRKLVGAAVAVARCSEKMEYLHSCFERKRMAVPAAPAEAVCLESISFGPIGGDWHEAVPIDGNVSAIARREIEARVMRDSRSAWLDFAARLDSGWTRAEQLHDLLVAARDGNLAGVAEALEAGARIDGSNDYGQTAAFSAAEQGHVQILHELLRSRADLSKAAHGGSSPCDVAHANGRAAVVEFFQELGMNAKVSPFFCKSVTPRQAVTTTL